MKQKLKKIVGFVKGLFPSRLPQGMTEFHAWADSFFDIYDLPTKEKDSIKFVLASIIMHLGPQTLYKSKMFFYLTICAGAAKQIAGAVFHDIKTKQAEEAAKAKEADVNKEISGA